MKRNSASCFGVARGMWTLRCFLTILVLTVVALSPVALAQTPTQDPSPTPPADAADANVAQLYARSVAAMRALDNPAFVSFTSAWESRGMRFTLTQDDDKIDLALGSGRDFADHHTYTVAYRRADRTLAITAGAPERLIGQDSHFLEPTWAGAYDLLRYGMHGGPTPSAAATPTPAPIATPMGTPLPTIGIVSAISAASYRVSDAGPGSCPDGTIGHVLKLTALGDPKTHPLTSVTIDLASNRFCSMRFNLNESGVVGVTGTYEVHFTERANYWLVSGGAFDVAVRVLGISARHVTLTWKNSDITTPKDVAAAQFVKPTPLPKP